MGIEAVEKIQRLWEITEDEDHQGLVRSLFTEIIYDLDTQRIVDFRLKPWADRFLVLRAALYEDELQKENSPSIEGLRNEVPHTGKRGTKRSIYDACDAVCPYLR